MNNNPRCEDAPCCGCCGMETDNGEGLAEQLAMEAAESEFHGWPGDGSGEDDLADYNQNEADDYGNEDAYLDAAYEDRTDLGDWGE